MSLYRHKQKSHKSFSKQFLGKHTFHIRQIKEPSLFGQSITYTIYGMIVLFLGVVFINLQPNSNHQLQALMEEEPAQSHSLTYLFYDKEGNEYSIFGASEVHGAPQTREYLFDGVQFPFSGEHQEQKADTNKEPLPDGEQPNIPVVETSPLSGEQAENQTQKEPAPSAEPENEPSQSSLSKGKKIPQWEASLLGKLQKGKEKEPTGIQIIPDYQKCDTSRGYQINHGESVLAYEQDTNTPDTCKIQRRFCFDGKLSGTFRQQSCNVNTAYSHFQEQFVSYTTKPKSELIQPSPLPSFTQANLEAGNTQQGVDELLATPNPGGTNRGKSKPVSVPNASEVRQTEKFYPDCKTPRGETVKHGQFIKAYKHKNGFSDAPCEVQLRTCVVGILEGTYQQFSCRHWDTSYIDWLNNYPSFDAGYSDEKMQWIKQLRANEARYTPEYGNTLQSAVLEKILQILDS